MYRPRGERLELLLHRPLPDHVAIDPRRVRAERDRLRARPQHRHVIALGRWPAPPAGPLHLAERAKRGVVVGAGLGRPRRDLVAVILEHLALPEAEIARQVRALSTSAI